MNYIAQINQFWQLRKEVTFSSVEADLYFYLLEISNGLQWKNPFQQSNALIGATLGISEKTLIAARNRLKQYGLIDFHPGVKRQPSSYRLLVRKGAVSLSDSLENFQPIREECDSESDSKSGSESGSVSGKNAPDINKRKQNKRTTTPNSPPAAVVVVDEPAKELTAAEQQWQECQTWMQENAPRCLTLDSTLFTADALNTFYATYTKANVQTVLRAVHGEASAAKYLCLWTGVNNICRHRFPALAAGKPKQADPQTLYGPDNPAVAAEQAAYEQQEAAARQARRQTPHAVAS